LKTKQKQLKLQDKGNKPKRACPPTDEEFYNKIYVVILEFDVQTVLSYLTI
jgi:hypothetical protein